MTDQIGLWALDSIQCVEFFELCAGLPDQSVDMILSDMPYGTTACVWDSVIPFEPMWKAFKRVIKPRGAIVLTASQPFTSALVMSNPAWFKYSLVWDKRYAGNFNLADTQPMRTHEDICIFAKETPNYSPQMTKRYIPIIGGGMSASASANSDGFVALKKLYSHKFPLSILSFPRDLGRTIHPTQKPVPLFRYLIRTYTQPGDIILDPCVGSGTTAYAAREEGRHWVCGDNGKDEKTGRYWAEIAQERMDKPYTLPMFIGESR